MSTGQGAGGMDNRERGGGREDVFPSTVIDPTHVAGQTARASQVFAGAVTNFSMTCSSAADCDAGQSCVTSVCMNL